MRTRLLLALLVCGTGAVTGCLSKTGSGVQPSGSAGLAAAASRPAAGASAPAPDYDQMIKQLSGQPAERNLWQKATAPARSFGQSLKQSSASVVDKLTPKPRVIPASDPVSLSSQPESIGVEVYYAAARLAEHNGQPAEALRQYRRGLEEDPEHLPTLISLARFHDRRGQFAAAVEQYRKAIDVAPDNAMAHNDLGLCFARNGEQAQAVTALSKAVQLEPTRKLYRNNRATILVQMGRVDEAWTDLSSVHPAAIAHYNMGYLLHKVDRKPEALHQFALASEADSSLTAAARMVQQLNAELHGQAAVARRPRPGTLRPGQPAQQRPVSGPPARPQPRRVPPIDVPPAATNGPGQPAGAGARSHAPRPFTPDSASAQPLQPASARPSTAAELQLPVRLASGQSIEPLDNDAILPTPDELGLE